MGNILYFMALCCIALYCIVLRRNIRYYIKSRYIILYYMRYVAMSLILRGFPKVPDVGKVGFTGDWWVVGVGPENINKQNNRIYNIYMYFIISDSSPAPGFFGVLARSLTGNLEL